MMLSGRTFGSALKSCAISRSFGAQARNRLRSQRIADKHSSAAAGDEIDNSLPKFQHLMRNVYKKCHPDLLRSHSEIFSRVNDDSMQILNGVLSSIKKFNDFPPQIVKTIPFHILESITLDDGTLGEKQTRLISLNIKTGGGECQKTLTKSFSTFFIDAGVLSSGSGSGSGSGQTVATSSKNKSKNDLFVWDKEYFPTTETSDDDDDVIMTA